MSAASKSKSTSVNPASAIVAKATHPNTKERGVSPMKKPSSKKSKSVTPASAIVAQVSQPETNEGAETTMSTSTIATSNTVTSTPATPAAATIAKATNPSPASIAKSASATLRSMESSLHLVTALSATEKKGAIALLRIPLEAITIGIDVAERHLGRFPDFDIEQNQYAVDYVQAMTSVAQQYRDTAARIEETLFSLHADAARQTLALYSGMKALSKVPSGQSMLPQIGQLKLLVRTSARRRSTGDGSTTPASTTTPDVTSGSSAKGASASANAPVAVVHTASAPTTPAASNGSSAVVAPTTSPAANPPLSS